MFFDDVADAKKITFSRSLGLINTLCFIFIFALYFFVQSITPLASIINDASQALN